MHFRTFISVCVLNFCLLADLEAGRKEQKPAAPLSKTCSYLVAVGGGVIALAAALGYYETHKLAPAEKLQQRAVEAVPSDRGDFVTPFSNARADKDKFLSLSGLTTDQTLNLIRAEGVDVLFVDGKQSKSDLFQQACDHFKAAERSRGDSLGALYVPAGKVLLDKDGAHTNQTFPRATILIKTSNNNSTRSALQHEYLHHLIESRRNQRELENSGTQSRTEMRRYGALRTELLKRQGKGDADLLGNAKESDLPLIREMWDAYFNGMRASLLSTKMWVSEWDVMYIQLETRAHMGLDDREVAHLLGYLHDTAEDAEKVYKAIEDLMVYSRVEASLLTPEETIRAEKLSQFHGKAMENLARVRAYFSKWNISKR